MCVLFSQSFQASEIKLDHIFSLRSNFSFQSNQSNSGFLVCIAGYHIKQPTRKLSANYFNQIFSQVTDQIHSNFLSYLLQLLVVGCLFSGGHRMGFHTKSFCLSIDYVYLYSIYMRVLSMETFGHPSPNYISVVVCCNSLGLIIWIYQCH